MNRIFKRKLVFCKSLFTVQFYPIYKRGKKNQKKKKKKRRPQEPILGPRFTSPRFTSPVQSSLVQFRNTVFPFRGLSENTLTWRRVIQRCISGWYFSYFSPLWYQVGQCYLLRAIHKSYIRGTQRQFSENTFSEDDLRSSIFGTLVVKFLACLPLLGFSNI